MYSRLVNQLAAFVIEAACPNFAFDSLCQCDCSRKRFAHRGGRKERTGD